MYVCVCLFTSFVHFSIMVLYSFLMYFKISFIESRYLSLSYVAGILPNFISFLFNFIVILTPDI